MYFPPTQLFNFFEDPQEVIDIANQLEFYKPGGSYPGLRTEEIHQTNPELFDYVCRKTLSVFYSRHEIEEMSWRASSRFQKITHEDAMDGKTAWVHRDNLTTFTSIIYLSEDMPDNGTGIYLPKTTGFRSNPDTVDLKHRFLMLGEEVAEEAYKQAANQHNNQYRQASYFDSVFNGSVIFDGCYPHKAHFNIPKGQSRLTLVTFFDKLMATRFPLPEARTVL